MRAHTRFLAHDLLAGRGTGSDGERIAALYIAAQLERLGLRPGDEDATFLLPVPLRAATVEPGTAVTLVAADDTTTFVTGEDFVLNTGGPGAFRSFHGPAIFLGDPAVAAARVRAPAASARLRNHVAVFAGPLGAAATDLIPALTRAGAAGVVLLVPDAAQFDLYRRSRGRTRLFVDAAVQDPVWQPDLPVLIAGPRLSAGLIGGSLAGAAGPDPAGWIELGATVGAEVDVSIEPLSSANVAGWIPGADPALRDEFVMFTAHHDHLGVGPPDPLGDSIYNGFSDNAAGVAMLLAIAASMVENPPARSVAFLFLTGEERGLLGSSYLAAAPPAWLPLDRVAALINLDAGAPPVPPVSWRVAGGEGTALGAVAAQVAAEQGWAATLTAASPNSDYWPFLARGVPAIFIIPGDAWQDTSPAERDALRRRWDRYHAAGDHWHHEFPFAGLQRYAEFARRTALRVADAPPKEPDPAR